VNANGNWKPGGATGGPMPLGGDTAPKSVGEKNVDATGFHPPPIAPGWNDAITS